MAPLRIAIGAILGTLGGPATYARQLIAALAALETSHRFVILTDAPDQVSNLPANFEVERVPLASAWDQLLWDHVRIPAALRRSGAALYHGTKGALPILLPCPAVVTIHDLASYHLPSTFAWPQRLYLRLQTPIAVRGAAVVIAVSEHARADIEHHFALGRDHTIVIPEAADPSFSPRVEATDAAILQRLGLRQPYVLYLGTIQPRKNVEMLVEAFRTARFDSSVELVIAGRVRPGYHPSFLQALPDRVRYLGAVEDADQRALYRNAMVFCSPSSYEGFGLSLLEAMQSGCLVIAARNTSVTEVVADAGVLLDTLSVATLREALIAAVNYPARFVELRQRASQRAKQFSWKATAEATLRLYDQVLRQHS